MTKTNSGGLCSRCKSENDRFPKKMCSRCLEKERNRKERLHQKGLCIVCGKENDRLPKRTCIICNNKKSAHRSNAYHQLKSEGLCVVCGGEKEKPSVVRCSKCSVNASKYDSVYRKRLNNEVEIVRTTKPKTINGMKIIYEESNTDIQTTNIPQEERQCIMCGGENDSTRMYCDMCFEKMKNNL